jgi:hypothetical protein
MNHKEFVKYLNKHGFVPCGSNGCLAHIPCDWLNLTNFKAAAERHQAWLNEQGVDIAKILKPASQSEGWCVLWANDGTNAGSGTYLLPKYWLGNSDILDPDAPRILHGYKLAFEFFRFVATKKWFQSKQELLAPGTILPDWPKVGKVHRCRFKSHAHAVSPFASRAGGP